MELRRKIALWLYPDLSPNPADRMVQQLRRDLCGGPENNPFSDQPAMAKRLNDLRKTTGRLPREVQHGFFDFEAAKKHAAAVNKSDLPKGFNQVPKSSDHIEQNVRSFMVAKLFRGIKLAVHCVKRAIRASLRMTFERHDV